MRKFAAAMAAALVAATVPAAAWAAPVINYTPNVGGTFGNDDPTTYPPHFNDTYSFFTDYARRATVEITSSMNIGDWTTNVNFISNGVLLNTTVIPVTSKGQYERRYLANFRIPAGVQQIVVKGASGENGSYAGLLTLSGVPEPATWALMIFGFGISGAALRRRRAQVRSDVAFA